MNKFVKWGIVGVIAIGLTALGIHSFVPRENKELTEAPTGKSGRGDKLLNVKGVIVRPQHLTDGLYVSGSLIPDEEVKLSFETSGKITHIYFSEGAHVRAGQLLAKINDAPLQAQLRRLEAQQKLVQDRLYRARALLEKEAVSKEAFQEAETNLATLRADIELMQSNIAQTELRAPFDGIIGLREVSTGAYASPTTTIATLTKTHPLKVEFAVPERYAGTLRPGASLTFSTEGDLERRTAKVYASDATAAYVSRGDQRWIRKRRPSARSTRWSTAMAASSPAATSTSIWLRANMSGRWPCRARPSCRKWASTRCISTRTAWPSPSTSKKVCAPTPSCRCCAA